MLERYESILKGEKNARYLENRQRINKLVERAWEIFEECCLCEHGCGVNRRVEEGICGVRGASIATHFMHYGEEEVLVPSYTVFFSGCNFRCIYCQNWDISQRKVGIYIEPEKMAYLIDGLLGRARNINWVGGEPTPNIPYILEVLKHCHTNIPQIWNSNMYCSMETMDMLRYVVDVYLTDFKYGNDDCAEKLSGVKNYWSIITRNHEIAKKQGEMIIRHLVLPGHVKCCSFPVIEWISDNAPDAAVNIMNQYYPAYRAFEYEGMNRMVSGEEYARVYKYGEKLGLNLI